MRRPPDLVYSHLPLDPNDYRNGPPSPHGRPNSRWGGRYLLSTDPAAPPGTRSSVNVVVTQLLPQPTPWVVSFRYQVPPASFAIDESAWTTVNPVEHVQRTRIGLDVLGGLSINSGTLLATINHPFEYPLGHSLDITLSLQQAVPVSLWVEVLATPVCCFDSTDVVAPFGGLGGWFTPVVVRVPVAVVDTLLLAGNVARRQFYIANHSTVADLAVSFGTPAASITPGAERFTFILPAGGNNAYESPIGGYTGEIRGIWTAADAAGEALVTAGFF